MLKPQPRPEPQPSTLLVLQASALLMRTAALSSPWLPALFVTHLKSSLLPSTLTIALQLHLGLRSQGYSLVGVVEKLPRMGYMGTVGTQSS